MFFSITLISSCDKGEIFDTTGPMVSEERVFPECNSISVFDDINVELTLSDTNILIVRAGKNIINGIETRNIDGVLTISNSNSFEWMQDLDPEITIFLPAKKINFIRHSGTGIISSEEPLTQDSLRFDIWDGAGTVDIEMDNKYLSISIHKGYEDVFVSGKTEKFYSYSNGIAPIDCSQLTTPYVNITNNYIGKMIINVSNKLTSHIFGSGNIYYFGNPKHIYLLREGSGELIPME